MPRFERPTLNPRLKCTLKCFDGWFSKKRALRADSLRSRFPRSLPECIPTKPTMTLTSCHGAKEAVFLVGRRRLPPWMCRSIALRLEQVEGRRVQIQTTHPHGRDHRSPSPQNPKPSIPIPKLQIRKHRRFRPKAAEAEPTGRRVHAILGFTGAGFHRY